MNEPLFVSQNGIHRLKRHVVRTLLRYLGERAEVHGVHPHRFNHAFAIQLLRNRDDVFTLQNLLGHSSMDMVRCCLQLAQIDLENTHRRESPADNWRLI